MKTDSLDSIAAADEGPVRTAFSTLNGQVISSSGPRRRRAFGSVHALNTKDDISSVDQETSTNKASSETILSDSTNDQGESEKCRWADEREQSNDEQDDSDVGFRHGAFLDPDSIDETTEDKPLTICRGQNSDTDVPGNSAVVDASEKRATVDLLPEDDDGEGLVVPESEEQPREEGQPSHSCNETYEKPSEDLDEIQSQPNLEDILASTDQLFSMVTDKQTVTIKDIMKSLSAEYNCKLGKELKAAVKERLTELVTESAQPSDEDDEVGSDSDDNSGDDDMSVASVYSNTDEKVMPKKTRSKKKSDSSGSNRPKHRRMSSRPKITKKTSAIRIKAEQLRKKRMDELRVRNEELQLNQRADDQKRAELIAAKFETNTDELRITRLEQRLDLLQKLDQKRLTIIQDSKLPIKDKSNVSGDLMGESTIQRNADEDSISDESESEVELEFVGQSSKPKAVELLELTERSTPRRLRAKTRTTSNLAARTSPGRGMNARDALRNKLVAKRRKMGNLWLARELGYKTEEEHLRDCMQEEERKRKQILKVEEERLRTNDRELLRERLMAEVEEEADENDGEEQVSGDVDHAEIDSEEDEEKQMARQLQSDTHAETAPLQSMTAEEGTLDSVPIASTQSSTLADELQGDNQMHHDHSTASSNKVTNDGWEDAAIASNSNEQEDSIRAAEDSAHSAVKDPPLIDNDDIAENVATENLEEIPSEIASPSPEDESEQISSPKKSNKPRNSEWKAMLEKEAKLHKKLKKRKGGGLIEDEAEEEEEEEVPGLEDFGFTVLKKAKQDDEEEEDAADKLNDDDLDNVVDDVSDNEGDEEAGEKARREMEKKEEKQRHKDIMQRMKNGYDGRRGGLATGKAGARGMHRFEELVAADNREDAKRLGLLNDDEIESDEDGGKEISGGGDEDEDEAVLLDKMLKDRFLHRSSVEVEENFSDDDDDPANNEHANGVGDGQEVNVEEIEQERQAKSFARRARMHRLIEAHGHDEEFSQSKLIDDDDALKLELQNMKNGLSRKRMQSNTLPQGMTSTVLGEKRQKTLGTVSFAGGLLNLKGSLAVALQASSRTKHRTSFVRSGTMASTESAASLQKSITFSHVVFKSNENSQPSRASQSNFSTSSKSISTTGDRKVVASSSTTSSSLWSRVAGFQKGR